MGRPAEGPACAVPDAEVMSRSVAEDLRGIVMADLVGARLVDLLEVGFVNSESEKVCPKILSGQPMKTK